MAKKRIRLVHWNVEEAREHVRALRDAGYAVVSGPVDPAELRALKARPPAAIIIDLDRLPGQGRDVGIDLRRAQPTRQVPLVFVGGTSEKAQRVRQALPDAVFTTWDRVESALTEALERPIAAPVVPAHSLTGYSGTPLPKKLGLKEGLRVALLDAPPDFEQALAPLPTGVRLVRQARGPRDLTIWFVRSQRTLAARIASIGARVENGGLWIAWPKKASGLVSDVSEPLVRTTGLANGLVDYKICAIDATWSGLKFARRKS
ncbi:MAG: hypothetical protein AB7O52_17470 [Planctomycetota bacterium]